MIWGPAVCPWILPILVKIHGKIGNIPNKNLIVPVVSKVFQAQHLRNLSRRPSEFFSDSIELRKFDFDIFRHFFRFCFLSFFTFEGFASAAGPF